MADSGITKKALAAAFGTIMEEEGLSKITIGKICEKCEMNRKSFYYHFRDKYDLINWIFDNDISGLKINSKQDGSFLTYLCEILWEKRRFYRQVFKISGQNSFKEYLKEILVQRVLSAHLEQDNTEYRDFYTEFLSDAIVCAIEKWLDEKQGKTPQEFSELIKKSIKK